MDKMKVLVCLVLLACVAGENTENAEFKPDQKEKTETSRENLLRELKTLVSRKTDEAARDKNTPDVEAKRETYVIHGGYLDVDLCPKKGYDYSYDSGYFRSSDWFDSSDYYWYDYYWYDWPSSNYDWSDYSWYDYNWYDWSSSNYEWSDYSWYDYNWYDWSSSNYDWNDYSWYDYNSYDWSSSDYDWSDYSGFDWSGSYEWSPYDSMYSYNGWSSDWWYDSDSSSYYEPSWPSSYDSYWFNKRQAGSSDLYRYYSCGDNLWLDEDRGTCELEYACGYNMWYGAKRGAKRVEDTKVEERTTLLRSLEMNNKNGNHGKRMVARSARPNPAKRGNRKDRLAIKGHQRRALKKQHARKTIKRNVGQHAKKIEMKKMAAMKARHEVAANRRMHTGNKMNVNGKKRGRKITRKGMGKGKNMEAREKMIARRKMTERAKLEERKKMVESEKRKMEEKGDKAGDMMEMKRERSLLERLKAKQLKAHEGKTRTAETANEANTNV